MSLTSPKDRPATTIARRRCRVHRIPPRVRDDREPPLWGRDKRAYKVDFSKRESGIFFASGLDTDLLICPTGSLKTPLACLETLQQLLLLAVGVGKTPEFQ
jgi:hypothetical protein